jgi:hypothetical protein
MVSTDELHCRTYFLDPIFLTLPEQDKNPTGGNSEDVLLSEAEERQENGVKKIGPGDRREERS